MLNIDWIPIIERWTLKNIEQNKGRKIIEK